MGHFVAPYSLTALYRVCAVNLVVSQDLCFQYYSTDYAEA